MEIAGQSSISGSSPEVNRYVEGSEAYTARETAATDGKNMLLNSLEPGSYLYGQVESSGKDGAVLLLENGQRLLAKLTEGVSLEPGQNVTFQVEKKQDGMVYMKPLFAEAALEMTAKKALMGADFMSTPKNLEIVKELLELNMPVDKNTIRSMLQKSVKNPDVPVKQLALFEKLGIPVTKENMEQLKQYQANTNQLGKQMDSLLQELGETTKQLLMEGKTEEAAKLNQNVLDFLYEELSDQEQSNNLIDGRPDLDEGKTMEQAPNPAEEGISGERNVTVEGEIFGEENELGGKVVPEDGKSLTGEVLLGEENKLFSGEKILPGMEKNAETVFLPEMEENADRDGLAAEMKESLPGVKSGGETVQMGKPDEIFMGTDRLADNSNPENIVGRNRETAPDSIRTSLKEQMFEIKELLDRGGHPEEIKKLLGSTKFQELLERGMKEAWQIKPEEFNGKDSINRSYAKVEEQARLLGELLKESSAESGSNLKTADNIQHNLEFMQDLNQAFPYIQLPLQMAGESAHGDLYVFKDQKRQHEAGEPFTAFLHLSMEHLGDVDVYLSLMEQKVSTDITLEQEAVLDLFEAHIDELTSRLEKKGYEVNTKLKISDKELNFVEDILAKQAGGSSVNRYSFDVKA